MISLQASDIFFCIRYDYLQDQNSAGSLFKELMFLHTVCFPACLLEICGRPMQEFFFPVYSACMNFFPLIFPCMNFFLYFDPPPPPSPPHNFSNGPSLRMDEFLVMVNRHLEKITQLVLKAFISLGP